MKKNLVLILVLVLGFIGISCSADENDDNQVTIKFVCNSGYVSEFTARITEFNKIYPNIKVEVEGISAASWGEMLNTIALDIIAGEGPDIADIASEGMYAFAESELLEDLTSYIERDQEELQETLNEIPVELLDAHKINGKVYSLPTVWNNMCIYYNKQVLKNAGLKEPQPGWTVDEFLEMCKKVVKNNDGGKDDVYGYSFFQNYFTTIEPWLQAFNSSVLTDDWSKANVNNESSKAAFQLLYDMVKTHKVAPSMGTDDCTLFAQNKLAFMGCGMWYVEKLKNYGFPVEDYDVVPFPSIDGQVHSVVGVGGCPIFKDSKNKEAAWKLAKFLSNKDFQTNFLSNNIWAIPSVLSSAQAVFEKPFFPKNSNVFWDSIENAKYVPAPSSYTTIEGAILREFGAYMANVKTLNEAMKNAEKNINEALNG